MSILCLGLIAGFILISSSIRLFLGIRFGMLKMDSYENVYMYVFGMSCFFEQRSVINDCGCKNPDKVFMIKIFMNPR